MQLYKVFWTCLIFLFIDVSTWGQIDTTYTTKVDSIAAEVDSLRQAADKKIAVLEKSYDSLSQKATKYKDSLQRVANKLSALPSALDTLKFMSRIDSVRRRMESISKVDSLFLFDPVLRGLDSLKLVMQNKSMELTSRIDRTVEKIQTSMDSLRRSYTEKAEQVLQKWGAKNPGIDVPHDKLAEQMNWDAPAVSTKFPELSSGLNFKDLWPDLKMGNFSVKELGSMKLPDGSLKIPGMPSLKPLQNVKGDLSKLKGYQQNLKGYQADLDSIRAGGLGNSDKLPELAEQQMMKREEIQTIKDHEKELEKIKQLQQEYLQKLEEYRDPEKLKAEALQKAGEVVTDEVTSQTDKLSQAQSQLGNAKRKYGDVQSINELPKLRPNPMKGKPFRERFFPGVTFQFIKNDQYSTMYLAPQIYYRLSGRWDVGGGGIINLNFNNKPAWVSDHDQWGYKVFTNFRLFKSFYLRVEGERVNQEIPLAIADKTYTRWTYVALGGIGKEFKISRLLNGNTFLFYNAKGQEFNPYSSRIVLRVGIDVSLKKDQRRQFIKGLTKQQSLVPQTTTIKAPDRIEKQTAYQPIHSYKTTVPTSLKYEFTIVLKDSTTVRARSRIELQDRVSSVVLMENNEKRTIKPTETIELYRMESNGYKFSGVPTDSCWLFLGTRGRINTYSNLAEHNIKFAIAVQQGDGPILPITEQNLIEMVGDHKRALELIEKKKYVKAVKAYNNKN